MKNKTLRNYCIGVGFLALFLYVGLPMFVPKIENRAPEIQFWDIKTTSTTHEVMGIILGNTTLESAIKRFGNRFELAVYVEKTGEMQLEVYFRETEVGRFTGRVAATLNATNEEALDAISRVGKGKALPNYRQKYILPEMGHLAFLEHTFKSIAFIPTAISLNEKVVEERFGKADQIIEERVEEGKVMHYLYANKGLDVQLSTAGPSLVQYTDVASFQSNVLEPLMRFVGE